MSLVLDILLWVFILSALLISCAVLATTRWRR